VARQDFAPFYPTFVPLAKSLLSEWGRDAEGQLQQLGLRALEAFALMGDAVGRDQFRPDAHLVLQVRTDGG
jgi:hypothetical protein